MDGLRQQCRVVSEHSDTCITALAQQGTHLAALVTVIQKQFAAICICHPADRAFAALPLPKCCEMFCWRKYYATTSGLIADLAFSVLIAVLDRPKRVFQGSALIARVVVRMICRELSRPLNLLAAAAHLFSRVKNRSAWACKVSVPATVKMPLKLSSAYDLSAKAACDFAPLNKWLRPLRTVGTMIEHFASWKRLATVRTLAHNYLATALYNRSARAIRAARIVLIEISRTQGHSTVGTRAEHFRWRHTSSVFDDITLGQGVKEAFE